MARLAADCSGVDPYFAGDVFADVLALGRHAGVQLERLEMDVRLDALGLQRRQRRLQPAQPHHAPGADDVRDEIDVQGLCHEPDMGTRRARQKRVVVRIASDFRRPNKADAGQDPWQANAPACPSIMAGLTTGTAMTDETPSTQGRYTAPDEVWAVVRDDYLSGLSAPECCRRHGVGLAALRSRASREGWRRADQPWTPPARLDPWDEGAALEERVEGDLDRVDYGDLAWWRIGG